MPKRKREEDGSEDGRGDVRQKRVRYKLQQGTAKLGHAFKIAKGFERQKLGRRRKNAAKAEKEKDLSRIDGEIAAVKTLDTTICAQHYLFKSLLKIKAVSTSPALPNEVRQVGMLSTDPAVLNVHARLCKANAVREVMESVLNDVQKALGINIAEKDDVRMKKTRLRAKDFMQEDMRATVEGKNKNVPLKDEVRRHDGKRDPEGEEQPDISDSNEVPDHFLDHLASSEDDSNGNAEANVAVEDLERQLLNEGIKKSRATSSSRVYDHAGDLSFSEDEAMSPSLTPEPQKASAPKKSAFLPSLTMGGYISGSGSDIDDDIDIAPKKNRRGQRERRAIWEKKFGAKAKHLTAQKRDEGWDPKRGATEMDRHGIGKRKGEFRANSSDRRNAHNPTVVQREQRRDDSGPIHPSWEAAKKAKEKNDAPVAFLGKKITFD